jgi:hypothetical protein
MVAGLAMVGDQAGKSQLIGEAIAKVNGVGMDSFTVKMGC